MCNCNTHDIITTLQGFFVMNVYDMKVYNPKKFCRSKRPLHLCFDVICILMLITYYELQHYYLCC
jgi:hypothetical protein